MHRTLCGPGRVVSVIAKGEGQASMSQIFKVVLATLAVSATFGAVQLASGHDLTGRRELASSEPAGEINRGAKGDRATLKIAQNATETITFKTVGLDDTSVVVRVPAAMVPAAPAREEARNRPEPGKSGATKRAVACEPPVSVLTEVAKLLEPGRCVT
jgi:hypothetical protein